MLGTLIETLGEQRRAMDIEEFRRQRQQEMEEQRDRGSKQQRKYSAQYCTNCNYCKTKGAQNGSSAGSGSGPFHPNAKSEDRPLLDCEEDSLMGFYVRLCDYKNNKSVLSSATEYPYLEYLRDHAEKTAVPGVFDPTRYTRVSWYMQRCRYEHKNSGKRGGIMFPSLDNLRVCSFNTDGYAISENPPVFEFTDTAVTWYIKVCKYEHRMNGLSGHVAYPWLEKLAALDSPVAFSPRVIRYAIVKGQSQARIGKDILNLNLDYWYNRFKGYFFEKLKCDLNDIDEHHLELIYHGMNGFEEDPTFLWDAVLEPSVKKGTSPRNSPGNYVTKLFYYADSKGNDIVGRPTPRDLMLPEKRAKELIAKRECRRYRYRLGKASRYILRHRAAATETSHQLDLIQSKGLKDTKRFNYLSMALKLHEIRHDWHVYDYLVFLRVDITKYGEPYYYRLE